MMITGPVTLAYVGLGANLGDPQQAVRDALEALRALPQTSLDAVSSLYLSAPVDAGGNDYVNAVARLRTSLPAHELLSALQGVEQNFGRERPFRNAPRTLDLDLLLYGEQTIHDAALEVPHPRMMARAFVLLPLLELDAGIVVPGKGQARDFLPAVHDQTIRRLAENRQAG
jgi:2-amino-4-hydroxy-6-hydroxymethyldihydropteridine diphosphokinase